MAKVDVGDYCLLFPYSPMVYTSKIIITKKTWTFFLQCSRSLSWYFKIPK